MLDSVVPGASMTNPAFSIALPKFWPAKVRSAMLHVVSLAKYAAVYTLGGRLSESSNPITSRAGSTPGRRCAVARGVAYQGRPHGQHSCTPPPLLSSQRTPNDPGSRLQEMVSPPWDQAALRCPGEARQSCRAGTGHSDNQARAATDYRLHAA
jgi:hypothetical protein